MALHLLPSKAGVDGFGDRAPYTALDCPGFTYRKLTGRLAASQLRREIFLALPGTRFDRGPVYIQGGWAYGIDYGKPWDCLTGVPRS